jgi:aryl-alcohol dehydrogenase-like predicted oxidoreductase
MNLVANSRKRTMIFNRLALGTVQLGMPYGYQRRIVEGITERPKTDVVRSILEYAKGKISLFETGMAYGNAEYRIGKYLDLEMPVVTKLWPQTIKKNLDVIEEIKQSIGRTKRRLEAVLLHTPQQIYDSDIIKELTKAKSMGLIKGYGVAVYECQHAKDAIDLGVDWISIPYSVLDQRFDTWNFFDLCKEKDIKVLARSPFLQGLLLADPKLIPSYLLYAKPYIQKFREIISFHDFTPVQAAMLYACHSKAHYVLFGVDYVHQLKEDISIGIGEWDFDDCYRELKAEFLSIPRAIIFPSIWGKKKQLVEKETV